MDQLLQGRQPTADSPENLELYDVQLIREEHVTPNRWSARSLQLPDNFFAYENKRAAEELTALTLFGEESEDGAAEVESCEWQRPPSGTFIKRRIGEGSGW